MKTAIRFSLFSVFASTVVAIANTIYPSAIAQIRYPEKYNGQTIPLGYDAKTMDEIAQILTEVVGQPFRTEVHSPEEFLEAGLHSGVDAIYQNAYTNCVYHQLKLNVAGKIPEADATFDNFESITASKPNTWKDFVLEHQKEFAY